MVAIKAVAEVIKAASESEVEVVGRRALPLRAVERKWVAAHMSVAALRFMPLLLADNNRYMCPVLAVRRRFIRLASMQVLMHPVRMLAYTHPVLMLEQMCLALTPEYMHPVRMLAYTHLVLMPEQMCLALTPEFMLQVRMRELTLQARMPEWE